MVTSRSANRLEMSATSWENMNRKLYIDGIRGVASVIVLFHHLEQFLVPRNPAWRSFPFYNFITDGNLAVYVFFVLSGFALSNDFVISDSIIRLRALAVKRYFRLTIPILASLLLPFLLKYFHLFYNEEAGRISSSYWLSVQSKGSYGLVETLRFSLYDVYWNFTPDRNLNSNLWTMRPELLGSFLIFCLLALTGNNRRRFLIWIPVAAFFILNDSFFISFIFGLFLAELSESKCVAQMRTSYAAFAVAVFALGIGAYIIMHSRSLQQSKLVLALFSAGLVFPAVISNRISWIFETKPALFLGKLSFPLYLTHLTVICTFSSYIYLYLDSHQYWSPATNSLAVLVVTIIVSFGVATLFAPIERFAISFSRRMAEYLGTV